MGGLSLVSFWHQVEYNIPHFLIVYPKRSTFQEEDKLRLAAAQREEAAQRALQEQASAVCRKLNLADIHLTFKPRYIELQHQEEMLRLVKSLPVRQVCLSRH